MRIRVTSVFVDDQAEALAFYTERLGFELHTDEPVGEGDRWLTVVAPDQPDGPQLLLEPSSHRAVGPFKQALVEDGIPAAQFNVDDVAAEHRRLSDLGVDFTMEPTDIGEAHVAVFDDTCGNLIQLIAQHEG